MHRNETDGEDRAADATRSPALPGPPLGEPVPLGQIVRAVVVKAGSKRLHLRVFGVLAPAKQDDRDQQER